MPYNNAVNCIIGQLKQISQNKRHCKINKNGHDFPSSQIFCHSLTLPTKSFAHSHFSLKKVISQCPILTFYIAYTYEGFNLNGYTGDEMFEMFNKPVLDEAAKKNKIIRFSHDPRNYDKNTAISKEWEYIKNEYGYKNRLIYINDDLIEASINSKMSSAESLEKQLTSEHFINPVDKNGRVSPNGVWVPT